MLRLDTFEFGELQVTPQGGLRIPATFARSGVFPYRQPDGTVRREYRPPSAVADPAFLASLQGSPVTNRHPAQKTVSANTWRTLAVGHVADDVRVTDQGMAGGAVYIMDAATIQEIADQGLRQLSPGLFVEVYDPTPGTTPEGVPYDGVQRVLRSNHVALVPRGRQGSTVGLRLDASGDEIDPQETEPPMKIKIAGKEYEAGSPEADKALADLQFRADAAETSRASLARLQRERLTHLRADLRRVGVEVRNDADEAGLMAEAISKMIPGFSVDGQSPDYVMGAFAAALAMLLADDESDDASLGEPTSGAAPGAPSGGAAAPASAGADRVRNDAIEARKINARADMPSRVVQRGADDDAREAMIKRGQNRHVRPE